MPQSLSYLLTHISSAAKDRAPVLDAAVRPALHAYRQQSHARWIANARVGAAVADHVHLAVRLSRTITMAQLIEELKTCSSKRSKTQSSVLAAFAWQRGYGAFSVGPSDLDALLHYIDNQEEHHKTQTSRTNIAPFSPSTASNTMNAMSGTDSSTPQIP